MSKFFGLWKIPEKEINFNPWFNQLLYTLQTILKELLLFLWRSFVFRYSYFAIVSHIYEFLKRITYDSDVDPSDRVVMWSRAVSSKAIRIIQMCIGHIIPFNCYDYLFNTFEMQNAQQLTIHRLIGQQLKFLRI